VGLDVITQGHISFCYSSRVPLLGKENQGGCYGLVNRLGLPGLNIGSSQTYRW